MHLVIQKALRSLALWQRGRRIWSCPVALGREPVGAKRREGDGKTPVGRYRICLVKEEGKYGRSLGLSYPGPQDASLAYAQGRIDRRTYDNIWLAHRENRRPPWGSPLGGEIYIHEGGAQSDWTQGCIALNASDMDVLFPLWPEIETVDILEGDPAMNHPFSSALWIAPSDLSASPVVERRFEGTGKAKLIITGLGYFEAKLNGQRLGDEWFQPVASDYEPRVFSVISYPISDIMTHRIYYRVFEVELQGDNLLEIQLGNGFFVQKERVAEGELDYGDRPKCIFRIETEQGDILSDGSEGWRDSDITYSNLFIGERHDPAAAKREGKVIPLPHPKTEFSEQIGAPDRHIRTLTPKKLGVVNGRTVYDAGENISGVVRISTHAKGEITLRFAENLYDDGTLNFESTGADYTNKSGTRQIMTDIFVGDGTQRVFEPKFVWHAFRYFDVEGEIDSAEVLVIHADVIVTATFDSNSEGLNFLFDAFVRSQLNNMHGSYPSDCPHRERLGYTGDGQAMAPAVMLTMDSEAFYRKWIRDILDCQDTLTGHVQHTAPFQGGGGGPGGWGCAIVLVPYFFYQQWADKQLVAECWEPMMRWISFLKTRMEDGAIVRELDGGWCLGDWCTLEKIRLPEPFVNTYYLIRCLRIMQELAEVIGKEADVPALKALEEEALLAFRRLYATCDGTQGADAYAAALGEQDAKVSADSYDKLGHFDTGFLCTDLLAELLFTHGYGDVAGKLLTTEDLGGYLYMKRHGATTLWEDWDGHSSHDHPMFGGPVRQLFEGVLGIRRLAPGWEKYEIKPQLPQGVNWAKGSILTPKGRITVEVKRTEGGIETIVS